MPKKPIDYSKTVIYTIKTGNSLYVGSTTNFVKRKNEHKSNSSNENSVKYNYKLYKAIRANDNVWCMLPYAKYPCNDKIDQTIEEERIRQLLKADLNDQSCGTGINFSALGRRGYDKHYWTETKDKRNQTVKCECGCNVAKQNLPRHKRSKKHQRLIQSQIKDK